MDRDATQKRESHLSCGRARETIVERMIRLYSPRVSVGTSYMYPSFVRRNLTTKPRALPFGLIIRQRRNADADQKYNV